MDNLTFNSFDKFQRKGFADRLTKVISTFYPFYDDSFVLSLNAKFGSGKTTFLQMWKNQLEDENYKVIYINAWDTDFDDEPLIPIISALLDGVKTGKGSKNLKSALQGTLGTLALLGNHTLEQTTGLNVYEIMSKVEGDLKASDLETIGEELYKEFSFKKKAYDSLKLDLSKYVENLERKPLIILVDELDRVRPDYAVKFLEAIKHIFSLKGVCFVLAVDRNQIEASVRQLYGEIDFENYYRRFITREAQLSEVKSLDLMPFLNAQAEEFFDRKRDDGITFPFKEGEQNDILQFFSHVCRAFNFAPREIESLFRIFSQFMAITKKDIAARKSWVEASILLIAIFIDDNKIYHQIGNSSISPKRLYEYLKDLRYDYTPHHSYERYIVLTALAFRMRSEQNFEIDEIVDICINQYGFRVANDATPEQRRSEILGSLGRTVDDWGRLYETSTFEKLYKSMEEWRTFIE